MGNKFKQEFQNLYEYKKRNNFIFFNDEQVYIDSFGEFSVLSCNITKSMLEMALRIAKEKSKFTMDANQAGIKRSNLTKLERLSQGILAEMFVHFLMMDKYNLNVTRYDLERETFEYSTKEYDLKIYKNNKTYEIETRSSNIRHGNINKFIREDYIIGPYTNKIKTYEDFSDFHFRPIYIPFFKAFNFVEDKIFLNEDIYNGKTKLYITGVATKDEMVANSIIGNLGQRGTQYHLIKVMITGDIKKMDYKINKI